MSSRELSFTGHSYTGRRLRDGILRIVQDGLARNLYLDHVHVDCKRDESLEALCFDTKRILEWLATTTPDGATTFRFAIDTSEPALQVNVDDEVSLITALTTIKYGNEDLIPPPSGAVPLYNIPVFPAGPSTVPTNSTMNAVVSNTVGTQAHEPTPAPIAPQHGAAQVTSTTKQPATTQPRSDGPSAIPARPAAIAPPQPVPVPGPIEYRDTEPKTDTGGDIAMSDANDIEQELEESEARSQAESANTSEIGVITIDDSDNEECDKAQHQEGDTECEDVTNDNDEDETIVAPGDDHNDINDIDDAVHDPGLWCETCDFLNHNPDYKTKIDKHRIRLPGTEEGFYPFQGYAAYFALRNYSKGRVTTLLCDAPGIGKTHTAILIFLILLTLFEYSDWCGDRVHSVYEKDGKKYCTLQQQYKLRLPCYCFNSVSSGLLEHVPRGSFVFVAPAMAIDSIAVKIYNSLRPLFEQKSEPARLHILASKTGKRPRPWGSKPIAPDYSRLLGIADDGEVFEDGNGILQYQLRAQPGAHKNFLVTSNQGLNSVVNKLLQARNKSKLPWRIETSSQPSSAGANMPTSLVVFDEVHKYKGSKMQPTVPFSLISSQNKHNHYPKALLMTATPFEKGAEDMYSLNKLHREHYEDQALDDPVFDKLHALYKKAISAKAIPSDGSDYKVKRMEVFEDILLCRSDDSVFFGTPLVNWSQMDTQIVQCIMPQEANYQAIVDQELKDLVKKEKDESRCSDDVATVRVLQKHVKMVREARITASFPATADATIDVTPPFIQLTTKQCMPQAATGLCHKAHTDSLMYQNLDRYIAHSPKLPQIDQAVQNLLEDESPIPGHEDARHAMVVLAEVPANALILYFYLRRKFNRVIDIYFYLPSMGSAVRSSVLDGFNSWEGTKPKIFISTTGCSAAAIELTRANYQILFDVPFMKRTLLQALRRCCRPGQPCETCYGYVFMTKGGVEQLVYARQSIRTYLNQVSHSSFDRIKAVGKLSPGSVRAIKERVLE